MLQDEKLWKKFLGREVIPENNSCELYFEEREFDCFVEKLERLYPEVQYVNRPMTIAGAREWSGSMIQTGI